MDLMDLNNPIYIETHKIRGSQRLENIFNIEVNPAAKLLMQSIDITVNEAFGIASLHILESQHQAKMWASTADFAATQLWGRRFEFTDYKISAIGSREFSQEFKTLLRKYAGTQSKHNHLREIFERIGTLLARQK